MYVYLKCLNWWKDVVDFGFICDYVVNDCLLNFFYVDSFVF